MEILKILSTGFLSSGAYVAVKSGSKKNDPVRRRIYGGVLLFAVIAGISIGAVPALRERLLDRVHIIKTAMAGGAGPEITATGENDIPYPEEFMRPGSGTVVSRVSAEPARKIVVAQSGAQSITPPVVRSGTNSANSTDSTSPAENEDDDSPRFRQGKIELEAYEKTLAANEKLTAMVQGGNPDLGFKTWGAVHRSGDIYWVRVIFQNADGGDVEYIWQTDMASGKIAPLNFNARSL